MVVTWDVSGASVVRSMKLTRWRLGLVNTLVCVSTVLEVVQVCVQTDTVDFAVTGFAAPGDFAVTVRLEELLELNELAEEELEEELVELEEDDRAEPGFSCGDVGRDGHGIGKELSSGSKSTSNQFIL